jgi:hypothetical protein
MYGGPSSDAFYALTAFEGSYLVAAGKRSSPTTQEDASVMLMNLNGDSIWSREVLAPSNEEFSCIEKSSFNEIYCAGSAHSTTTLFDYIVSKFSAIGQIEWSHNFGGLEEERAFDMLLEESGNIVIFGYTNSFPGTSTNVWMLRLNSDGDSLWSRSYGTSNEPEVPFGACANESGYAVCGYVSNRGLILQIGFNGDSLWTLETDGEASVVQFKRIVTLADNTAIVSGHVTVGNDANILVGKIDLASHSFVWLRSIGNPSLSEYSEDMVVVNNGNVIVVGQTASQNSVLVAVSDTGDSLWYTTSSQVGLDISTCVEIIDCDLFVGGYSETLPFSYQMQLTKFNDVCTGAADVVEYPNGTEMLPIFSSDTIRWTAVDSQGGVSIDLNRHFPIGEWEVITDSTENDGEYEWFVTDPLSDSCRIRICALQDTFCDVSDGNFSIVSSQGYLALVRSVSPNAPLTDWDFGEVECPQTASQWFRFKNFGSESIVVFQPLEPATNEFSRTTTCGAFFALAPNQMSACSVRVVFDAASDGVYNDVLRVQTDAVNGADGFVEFGLSGEQISTPAAPNVVIQPAGLDVQLSWSVVDSSVGGCPVSDLWYAVFYSPTEGGPFYFHGWTVDTNYTHYGVVNFSATQFYQVLAVEGPAAVAASLDEGMTVGEVMEKVREESRSALKE